MSILSKRKFRANFLAKMLNVLQMRNILKNVETKYFKYIYRDDKKLYFLNVFKCYLRIMGLPKAVHITPTEKCLIGTALQSKYVSSQHKNIDDKSCKCSKPIAFLSICCVCIGTSCKFIVPGRGDIV
jgi:hypothetical protein